MKKKIIVEITAFLLCIILLIGATGWLGRTLIPERYDYGGTWNMYLEEPENTIDLLFLGSSHAYCNVVPAALYEETGVESYVLSAPCMTMPLAYSYLKEGLKTQRPQVLMLEATGFFFNRYMGFAKPAIGYMPAGLNRLEAIWTSAEPEEIPGLLFPLYNYHDRWDDIPLSAYFQKRADQKCDPNAGYTLLTDAEAQNARTGREFEYTEKDIALQQKYLQKIIALCEKEGIALELFIAPACSYVTEADQERLLEVTGDIKVTDFNEDFDAFGFDLETDFFDSRHLNLFGAEKFSRALAGYIEERYSIQNPAPEDILWAERTAHLQGVLNGL